MKKDTKSFALGTLTSYLSLIVSIIINILMVPLLMRNLGDYSYGIWITLSSIFGAMAIADLGMGQSVAKIVSANSDSIDETYRIKKIISTAFFTSILISFLLLVINITLSFYINRFINVERTKIQLLYIFLFLNFIVNFVSSVFNNILIGYKKIYIINILNIGKSSCLFLFSLIFFRFSNDLTLLAVIYLIVSTIYILATISMLKKIIKEKILSYHYFDKEVFRSIFKPGVYFFIIQISGLIVYNTDNIVLSHFVNLSTVALYSSAYKIIDIFMRLIFVVIDNLFPYISSMDGKRMYDEIRELNIYTSKFSLGIGIFLSIMYYMFSKNIIEIWLGTDKYIGSSVIIAFCIILTINSSTHNSAVYINALHKHKKIASLSFWESSFNLIFSLTLVKYFGAVGVAVGTCMAAILTSMWFIPAYCCNVLKIKISYYIRNVVLKNLGIGMIFLIVVGVQKRYFIQYNNLLVLFLVYLINGAIFAISYYYIVLNNQEKIKTKYYIGKITKK